MGTSTVAQFLQSGVSSLKEYAGHLIDLADIKYFHAGGHVVVNGGGSIGGLDEATLNQLKADWIDYKNSSGASEADRASAEAGRVKAEQDRVSEFSGIVNNFAAMESAEAQRVDAEKAREVKYPTLAPLT